eukprot:COSAG03_NODE_2248_length_2959_cov_33.941958_3_plen_73_part_00
MLAAPSTAGLESAVANKECMQCLPSSRGTTAVNDDYDDVGAHDFMQQDLSKFWRAMIFDLPALGTKSIAGVY